MNLDQDLTNLVTVAKGLQAHRILAVRVEGDEVTLKVADLVKIFAANGIAVEDVKRHVE